VTKRRSFSDKFKAAVALEKFKLSAHAELAQTGGEEYEIQNRKIVS